MSVLLIAEHNNKEVKPFTLNAITAASQINDDLHVLVIGKNADPVAKSLSEVPNVKKVIHVDNDIYENLKSLAYLLPESMFREKEKDVFVSRKV